jgi:hypothetical protein
MNINEDEQSQRTRNPSYVSERDKHDNESTITVNKKKYIFFLIIVLKFIF